MHSMAPRKCVDDVTAKFPGTYDSALLGAMGAVPIDAVLEER